MWRIHYFYTLFLIYVESKARSDSCVHKRLGIKLMNLRHEVNKTRVHCLKTVIGAVVYATIYTIAPIHLHALSPIILVLVALLKHESPCHISVACKK